jgi:Ca2+/Na+ antiporter
LRLGGLSLCVGVRSYYLWCFLASVFWIGALSFLMVTWATTLGCLLHINPAVMGVTVLAAGTSVPDAMASLLVAARGQVGRATRRDAHCGSARVFWLGVSRARARATRLHARLPHVLRPALSPTLASSPLRSARAQGDMAVSNAIGSNVFDILLGLGLPWAIATIGLHQPVAVDVGNLGPMAVILFGTLAIVMATVRATGFTLTKPVGLLFFSLYVLFCAYVLLQEFGVIR